MPNSSSLDLRNGIPLIRTSPSDPSDDPDEEPPDLTDDDIDVDAVLVLSGLINVTSEEFSMGFVTMTDVPAVVSSFLSILVLYVDVLSNPMKVGLPFSLVEYVFLILVFVYFFFGVGTCGVTSSEVPSKKPERFISAFPIPSLPELASLFPVEKPVLPTLISILLPYSESGSLVMVPAVGEKSF